MPESRNPGSRKVQVWQGTSTQPVCHRTITAIRPAHPDRACFTAAVAGSFIQLFASLYFFQQYPKPA